MKKPLKLLLYALGGIFGVWLTARFLLPIGLPFLLGLALARLAERPVCWLRRRAHLPSAAASVLCISALFALLALLLWLLGKTVFSQTGRLFGQLPAFLESLRQPLANLRDRLLRLSEGLPPVVAEAAGEWLERFFSGSSVLIETMSNRLLAVAADTITLLPNLVLFLLTTLLSAYLLSIELPMLKRRAARVLPEAWRKRISAVWRKLKGALGGYCRAQLRLMLVTFVIVTAGLLVLRRDYALLLGVVIAAVDALPVFGTGTILIPWGIISALRGDTAGGVGLLLLYALSSVTRTLLEPKIVGRQIGLDPLLTLLSIYAGYRLFGLLGMLLLPIAVILCKQLYDLLESA